MTSGLFATDLKRKDFFDETFFRAMSQHLLSTETVGVGLAAANYTCKLHL
jgi:hypothetical protein